MEDYSRDLEKELNKYSVPNPFKQTRNWQLLFVSDDGKTIAVKRYKGLVITILAVLIITILFSSGLTVLYYKSIVEKKSLRVAVTKATKALNKATEEKELLNARLFFEKKDEARLIKTTEKAAQIKKGKTKPEKAPEQPVVEKISVNVEGLSITKAENSRYTKVRFLIKNASKLKRISGYVFVVLKPDSGQQKDWRILPPVLIRGGEPSMPGKGRFFSINHFKSMNFKFKDTTKGGYRNITIFVYPKTDDPVKIGQKILESTYPVKVKTIKSPVTPKKSLDDSTGTKKEVSISSAVPVDNAPVKKGAEENLARNEIKKNQPAPKTVKVGGTDGIKQESSGTINVEGVQKNAE